MNNAVERTFIDKGCLPHQARFAAAFFAPNASRKQLLLSAPGMGKGFAATAIVNHAISSGLARRTLVLAPRALLSQWQERLQRDDFMRLVLIVDRRRFRELEDSQQRWGDVWPTDAVVVMSFDFAKQADVAAALARCEWDLLVVDEAQLAAPRTQREKVLLDLIDRSARIRVLLLQVGGLWTTSEIDTSEGVYRDAAVTVWNRQSVVDHDGTPLLPEVRMEFVMYRRQPQEAQLLSALQESLRSLDMANAQTRFAATKLLQSASSSLFAFEQRLRRIRQRRNELAHGIVKGVGDEADAEETGTEEPEDVTGSDQFTGYMELAKVADPLLTMLDDIATDSKCDAFLHILDSVGVKASPEGRVCVFTSMVDTASYLESALQDAFPLVRVMTGGQSVADREQAIADFARTGGILITTAAMETALPEVAAVVFYDLPLSPAVLESRIGQFVNVGRRDPVRVIGFLDEAESLPVEELQRKIAEARTALSQEEIDEVLFPKESNPEP